MATTKAHPANTFEAVSSQIRKGNTAAAAREPEETWRRQKTTPKKTPAAKIRDMGETTKKLPAAVATPLPPPLNRKKIGKRCPQKADKTTVATYNSRQD